MLSPVYDFRVSRLRVEAHGKASPVRTARGELTFRGVPVCSFTYRAFFSPQGLVSCYSVAIDSGDAAVLEGVDRSLARLAHPPVTLLKEHGDERVYPWVAATAAWAVNRGLNWGTAFK